MSITYDPADGYTVTDCQTVRAGIGDFSAHNSDRAVNKITSLLRKKNIESLALSLKTRRFFPLATVTSRDITDRAFATHCKAEAALLLNRPSEYLHDQVPYPFIPAQDSVSRHLLFYYPSEPFETVHEKLRSYCSIKSGTHYLRPTILSIAASFQPFILLELEREYVTFSRVNNGQLEYFSYWKLNHDSDAVYFPLRELTSFLQNSYPVYITGTLSSEKSLTENISRSSGITLHTFSLVDLFSIRRNVRSSCNSPLELNALSTALMSIIDDGPL